VLYPQNGDRIDSVTSLHPMFTPRGAWTTIAVNDSTNCRYFLLSPASVKPVQSSRYCLLCPPYRRFPGMTIPSLFHFSGICYSHTGDWSYTQNRQWAHRAGCSAITCNVLTSCHTRHNYRQSLTLCAQQTKQRTWSENGPDWLPV